MHMLTLTCRYTSYTTCCSKVLLLFGYRAADGETSLARWCASGLSCWCQGSAHCDPTCSEAAGRTELCRHPHTAETLDDKTPLMTWGTLIHLKPSYVHCSLWTTAGFSVIMLTSNQLLNLARILWKYDCEYDCDCDDCGTQPCAWHIIIWVKSKKEKMF